MYSFDPEDQEFTDVTSTITPPLYDNVDAESQDSGLWYANVTEVDVKEPTMDKPVARSARESSRTSTRGPRRRPVTIMAPPCHPWQMWHRGGPTPTKPGPPQGRTAPHLWTGNHPWSSTLNCSNQTLGRRGQDHRNPLSPQVTEGGYRLSSDGATQPSDMVLTL